MPTTATQTLSFDVKAVGLTTSSFIANGSGYFFSVDVVGIDSKSGSGLTGNIGANSQVSSTPEPSTLALVTAAISGLAWFRRKR